MINGSKKYEALPQLLRQNEDIMDCLELMDKIQWPPEDGYLIWDPATLDKRASDLFTIHKLVIFRELWLRPGVAVQINLFNMHWRAIVDDYVLKLPPQPDELRTYMRLTVPRRRVERCRRTLTPEEIARDEEALSQYPDSVREIFGDIIKNLRHVPIITTAEEWEYILGRCARPESHGIEQSPYGFNQSKLMDVGFSNEAYERILLETALRLRLQLWWGWAGAPFACMQRIIDDNLAFLVHEGYLVSAGPSKYYLSELGREKLQGFLGGPPLSHI